MVQVLKSHLLSFFLLEIVQQIVDIPLLNMFAHLGDTNQHLNLFSFLLCKYYCCNIQLSQNQKLGLWFRLKACVRIK